MNSTEFDVENVRVSKELLEAYSDVHGDSYYLLDTKKFEENFDEFLEAYRSIYPKTYIGYSYKTNYTPRLCSIVDKKGGYAEVVSEMEYDLAIRIGVLPENIIVNGPYKNKNSLEKFLLGGSLVNLDSFHEVNIVNEIAKEHPTAVLPIGIRCNFEINDSLVSRFGFDVESDTFYRAFEILSGIDNVNLKGLHCHFPNRDIESYVFRIDKMLSLTSELFSRPPEFIDIGGGYFGKMNDSLKAQFNCQVPNYSEYASVVATRIKEFYKDVNEALRPKLFLEPGSALVANTMKFVAKVVEIKKVRNKFIAMTSGSKFNIGLLSSTVNMPMQVYGTSEGQVKYKEIDISGYTCIEKDYLYIGYSGSLAKGNFVVFDNVGSYSVVFKSPFILPNVPVIEQTTGEVLKRQEKMSDIFNTFTF
jgi:diaminopimelate decarboxylase